MQSKSMLRGTRRVAAAPEMPIEFFNAYVEAALWSTTDNSDEQGGEPLDQNYSVDDIADESLAAMEQDCQAFWQANHEDLGQYRDPQYSAAELGGHNFWLTRNGHGAGFWDGDLPDDVGKRLTEAAKAFGEDDLYVGDDGKIYNSATPHQYNEALDQQPEWVRGAGVRGDKAVNRSKNKRIVQTMDDIKTALVQIGYTHRQQGIADQYQQEVSDVDSEVKRLTTVFKQHGLVGFHNREDDPAVTTWHFDSAGAQRGFGAKVMVYSDQPNLVLVNVMDSNSVRSW